MRVNHHGVRPARVHSRETPGFKLQKLPSDTRMFVLGFGIVFSPGVSVFWARSRFLYILFSFV